MSGENPNLAGAVAAGPSPTKPPAPSLRLTAYSMVVLVLAAAVAVRLIGLGDVPPPLFRDEAEKGYNAWCLLRTGCDYEGRRLPLFVSVFGAHTSAIYQYVTVPLVGLFGLKVWSVRLTAALVGIATVLVLYLLGRAMFDRPTALLAAAILAFLPWHICFSRWAQQGVFMPFLFTVAAWGTVRFQQGWRAGLPTAAAAIALAAYAYDVGRVLAPLFLLLLAVAVRRDLKEHKRRAIVSALLLAVLVAPQIHFLSRQTDEALARWRRISIAQPGATPAKVLGKFILNYLSHFDPVYLAFRGDRELRHSPGPMIGEIYPLEIPFLVIGLYFLATGRFGYLSRDARRKTTATIVIGWILIAPVASSMTRVGIPHALRSLAGVPAFALATAVGVVEIVRRLKSDRTRKWAIAIFAAAESLCVASFVFGYFVVYPRVSARSWQAGIGDALAYCRNQSKPTDEIWISESIGATDPAGALALPPEIISPTKIFVAFYERISPEQFQRNDLRQTRFRVVSLQEDLATLLTDAKSPPMYVIAFVGQLPGRKPAATFADMWPDYPGPAVYRIEP